MADVQETFLQVTDLEHGISSKKSPSTKLSCRHLSFKCAIIFMSFTLLFLNQILDFLKDIMENKDFWYQLSLVKKNMFQNKMNLSSLYD